MADVIYPAGLISNILTHDWSPAVVRRLLGGGVVVAVPVEAAPEHTFEGWLVERWLREIRSEAFRQTAEYEGLRAQWEREG